MNKGDKFTQRFVVNEAIYRGFVKTFNDQNPLHTNESFALSKGFRGRVMHGAILVGFASYLVGECLPVKEVIVHSYNIYFAAPVYMDDVIILDAEIIEFFESVGTYEMKVSFTNQVKRQVARGKINVGMLV